jgi:hypothetical protein
VKDPRRIYLVDPKTVKSPVIIYPGEVRRQKERLQAEGQIEPIEVTPDLVITEDAWAYAGAQVTAAIELDWDTILVTY